MAAIAITNSIESLRTIFSKIKSVFFVKSIDMPMANLATFDMEFPVISDGVTFDMGSPDVSNVRLTTGAIWTSFSELGDPDVSFQVSSLDDEINSLFLSKVGDVTQTNTLGGKAFKGAGYNLTTNKVTGGLYLLDDTGDHAIFMPSVEMFGSPIIEQGSKPAYYNVQVTPVPSPEGQIIILEKTA